MEIADKLNSSPTVIRRVRTLLNIPAKLGSPEQLSFDDLNKDGEFEKFFKEYLEKKSKMEIAGRTRGSTLWPIIEEALKTVPKNASLKEKYNAIKNFDKRDSEYGYAGSNKVGRRLGAAINLSFENAKKGFGKLNIKTGELVFINAGHESILTFDENKNYEYIKSDMPPIGIVKYFTESMVKSNTINLKNLFMELIQVIMVF